MSSAYSYDEPLTATSTARAVRTPQVLEYLERLDKAIDEQSQIQEHVVQRLSGVIRQEGAVPASQGESRPEPVLVPIADRINVACRRLNAIAEEYRRVLSRVEV